MANGAPAAFAPWRPWLGDGDPGFPSLRVRGPVAIVNLSSAVQTPLHLAQGSLGREQIEQAGGMLVEAGARGLYRVLLVHHPVARGVVSGRKALTDRDILQAMLKTSGAELILHGHAHEALLTGVPGPNGTIPAMGVPSASTPTGLHDQAARWNELEILRDGPGFRTRVTARGVTADLGVETLGQFTL